MSEVKLNSTPRQRTVLMEQVRVVGEGLRAEAIVAAIVLGIATTIIAVAIAQGNAGSWFDSDEWIQIGVIAFVYPFAVWRRDPPFASSLFWTFPVDRRRLAAAKVFAGWVWLMVAVAAFYVWELALAAFSGVADPRTMSLAVFTGTSAMYLFGSAIVLGLRHPLRWVFGAFAVFILQGMFNEAGGASDGESSAAFAVPAFVRRSVNAWGALPELAQSLIAAVVLLGAGAIALVAALSRHAEARRS